MQKCFFQYKKYWHQLVSYWIMQYPSIVATGLKQVVPAQHPPFWGPRVADQHCTPANCQCHNNVIVLYSLRYSLPAAQFAVAVVVVVLVQPPSLTSPQGQEPQTDPAPHLRSEDGLVRDWTLVGVWTIVASEEGGTRMAWSWPLIKDGGTEYYWPGLTCVLTRPPWAGVVTLLLGVNEGTAEIPVNKKIICFHPW